jgi:2-methylaconitate cis-trans-isomerase PrpF
MSIGNINRANADELGYTDTKPRSAINEDLAALQCFETIRAHSTLKVGTARAANNQISVEKVVMSRGAGILMEDWVRTPADAF